jgi:hypothetical protein
MDFSSFEVRDTAPERRIGLWRVPRIRAYAGDRADRKLSEETANPWCPSLNRRRANSSVFSWRTNRCRSLGDIGCFLVVIPRPGWKRLMPRETIRIRRRSGGAYAFPYSFKPAEAARTHVANEHFNPDCFIKLSARYDILVVEVKAEGDDSNRNRAKCRDGLKHFETLNQRLGRLT